MCSKMISKILTISIFAGIILVLTGNLCVAEMGKNFKEHQARHIVNSKSITGAISTIQPTFIGIITQRDNSKKEETEMLFLVDEEVIFKKKSLGELLEGDYVKITYDNITEPDPEDPSKELFVQRETKEIQFLRSQSTSLSSGE